MLAELAEALESVAGGAARMRAAGEAAYTWHRVDEELEFASLAYDSLLDPDVVVRGAQMHRTVLFEGASGSVELQRSGDTLVGQVIPPENGEISLVAASGQVTDAEVDELGCFHLEGVPAEPVKFRWRTATASLVTDWIRL
jgi:hypothetical protein